MDGVKGAVACTVVALLAAHQLSTLDPVQRASLWSAARAALGADTLTPTSVPPAIPQRVAMTVAPATPFGEESIAPDHVGQYQTDVEIDGERLPVLVDTGATFVALRPRMPSGSASVPSPPISATPSTPPTAACRSPRSSSPRCASAGSSCATSRRWSAAAGSSARRCSA